MSTLHPHDGNDNVAGYIGAGGNLDVAELGITERNRAIGRCSTCKGGRLGVLWRRRSGVTMDLVPCPLCGGRLYQTTPQLHAPFYVLTDAYVAASAKAGKAAAQARQAERIAAGATKLVRDLEPGDVVVLPGGAQRVVAVDVRPASTKTRRAVELAVQVDKFQGATATYVYELRNVEERTLGADAGEYAWADLEPGEAILRFARDRAEQYRRFEAHARERAATYGTRVAGEVRSQADSYAADAAELEGLVELLESAKVNA